MATSKEKYREIFKRLASDKEFRERMEKDPSGVLKDYGIECDRGAYESMGELPSSDELNKRMGEIVDNINNYDGAATMHVQKFV